MKSFGVSHLSHISRQFTLPILLAVFVTLLSGWLILDWRSGSADSNPSPSDALQIYTSEDFTIELPAGFVPQASVEDVQDVFTFENANGTEGFQVSTMPVNDALPATAEKLQEGLPDMLIQNFQNATVAGEAAITFYSHDDNIGDTSEVWFVHDALLYQVMTYRPLETWLMGILQTWRFR